MLHHHHHHKCCIMQSRETRDVWSLRISMLTQRPRIFRWQAVILWRSEFKSWRAKRQKEESECAAVVLKFFVVINFFYVILFISSLFYWFTGDNNSLQVGISWIPWRAFVQRKFGVGQKSSLHTPGRSCCRTCWEWVLAGCRWKYHRLLCKYLIRNQTLWFNNDFDALQRTKYFQPTWLLTHSGCL